MAEKAAFASDASATVQPGHVQRYSKRQAVGRLFAIAATASIILYGLPQGMFIAAPIMRRC
jgi:endothelin-converting enzyme